MQKNHTFYFISYPAGAGGAHLANVISLEPTFSPKNSHLSKEEFLNYLNFFYSSENNNQHIDNHKIVNDKSWKEELPSIIDKFSNSVHLGHAASFHWANMKIFKNKKYICLTFNTEESLKLLRDREFKIFKTDTLKNRYYLEELRFFYSSVTHEINIQEKNVLKIEISELCVPDIKNVLIKINEKFNLSIPYDLGQKYHWYWYNKNFQ